MEDTIRVLVTGATGFVGWHLLEALRRPPFEVRALVRREADRERLAAAGVDAVVGRLEDADSLAAAVPGSEVVIHMAAATRAASEAAYERVNVHGTRNLVAALRVSSPRPRRLVYLSSLAAVGPSLEGRPVRTDDPPRPITAYGRTKLAGERVCLEAGRDIGTVIVRAPAVYGPRDRDLLTFFRLAARGVLPVPTGPERPLQLVHATDLADSLVLAATVPAVSGVYHAAERTAYAWAEVTRLVARAVGRSGVVVPLPGVVLRGAAALSEAAARLAGRPTIFNRDKARELLAPGWLCEVDTARSDLGFEARIPLAEGLASTAEWYRSCGWL